MLRIPALLSLCLATFLALPSAPAGADEWETDEGASPPRVRRPPPEPEAAPPPARPSGEPAPRAAAPEPEAECFWLPDIRCGRRGRFEGFQQPISQPFLFEDPFITTGVTAYHVWHEFPRTSALGGGDLHAVALQARVALTDRLAFIATKDGYGWESPDNPLLDDQTGWFNLAGGFKYALVQRPEDRFILSAALRLEYGTGSSALFEGATGGVVFIPSLSAAWGTERLHLIGDVGGQAPTDGDVYSSQFFYHAYADYRVHRLFQPFVQVSGLYYIDGGTGSRPVRLVNGARIPMETARQALNLDSFEGVDVHNLGNVGVGGNHVVVGAVGAHVGLADHVTLSVAYERPLTDRKDIHKQRVTTALRLEF